MSLGSRVRVSLCDTGVLHLHPALKGRATRRSSLRDWNLQSSTVAGVLAGVSLLKRERFNLVQSNLKCSRFDAVIGFGSSSRRVAGSVESLSDRNHRRSISTPHRRQGHVPSATSHSRHILSPRQSNKQCHRTADKSVHAPLNCLSGTRLPSLT